MNNVLELKGKKFIHESRGGGGGTSMNGNEVVRSSKLNKLEKKLKKIKEFWEKEDKPFKGVLVSVYYNKIAAKSNRINTIFKGKKSNESIVGAKFNDEKNKHIITYYLKLEDLDNSIELLKDTRYILDHKFNGSISQEIFNNKKIINTKSFEKYKLAQTKFKGVVADVSYIDDFEIEYADEVYKESIVTLYDTKTDTKELLKKLGIDVLSSRILDNETVFLDSEELEILYEKVPYLISMSTVDISKLSLIDLSSKKQDTMMAIEEPGIEPTIGVIDTLFDERVYFSDWVEYHDLVDDNISKDQKDYRHGTAVSSIIVDGPALNPWLDDGCGRFKVRHFGVAIGSYFSSFSIIKKIKQIIVENRDIKVWNISLGSNDEVNESFISAEAAALDKIQFEEDIIFVIAGTNKPISNPKIEKIGSPADSINSMVVNSVSKDGLSTSYARKGIVLSFFAKPDVSYYGGSKEERIKVCEPLGLAAVSGTSYAAPWIARKLSYLIDILGLNRELAKALIIDAARGWDDTPTSEELALYGHGIVPIKIEDIVKTGKNEIKFLVSDVSEKWNSYSYNFPVPLKDDKYPFVARATMCYFPVCDRRQGVDYTNTELNVKLGRVKDNGEFIDIKGDTQNTDELGQDVSYLLEKEARENFRKWDNVKYVVEKVSTRNRPKKSYANKNWGLRVTSNNRLDPKDGEGIAFGVVVTLKEIKGVNRIDEFIKNCHLNGWIVNELDIDLKLDIHETLSEDIEFE